MTDEQVGAGVLRFRWHELSIPGRFDSLPIYDGVAHHGLGLLSSGDIVVSDPGGAEVLVLREDLSLLSAWSFEGVQPHGIRVVRSNGEERIWIADNGARRVAGPDGTFVKEAPRRPVHGQVTEHRLDGSLVRRLPSPATDEYATGDYSPTSVALSRTGNIWVADGHGQHLVHCFDSDGRHVLTLDGCEGAGRFDHPHDLFIERRGLMQELLVADRNNGRIQVFDLQGRFIRTLGEEYLERPTAIAAWGEYTLVADTAGYICVIDEAGRLVATLSPPSRAGASSGGPCTPHAMAVDAGLNVYLTEYVPRGRIVRLEHFGVAGDRN